MEGEPLTLRALADWIGKGGRLDEDDPTMRLSLILDHHIREEVERIQALSFERALFVMNGHAGNAESWNKLAKATRKDYDRLVSRSWLSDRKPDEVPEGEFDDLLNFYRDFWGETVAEAGKRFMEETGQSVK